jgi:nicotinate-nucleotide adenylyltransferase
VSASTPTARPSAAPRRIGLFGGSFDPVHAGHLRLAHVALQALALDEVHWIPVGQPWQKARQLAPAEHRLAMIELAVQGEPRFVVDRIEVDRGGPSYTIDTVSALQTRAGDADPAHWFLIIGQDQHANLPTWHGWQELLGRVTLAVACRGKQQPQSTPELDAVPHAVVTLPMPPMAVSSTEIRQRLARGEPMASLADALAGPAVAGYIANHQLYANGAPR